MGRRYTGALSERRLESGDVGTSDELPFRLALGDDLFGIGMNPRAVA